MVEFWVGEAEALAKFFPGHGGVVVLGEDGVGGVESGWEVVDKSAGPVEDECSVFHDKVLSVGGSWLSEIGPTSSS